MQQPAGIVLRVHYKSMKCDVVFLQGSIRTGEVDIFSYTNKKISFSLQQCKNYKNRSRFPKVRITNILPPFYGSQCIMAFSVFFCAGLSYALYCHKRIFSSFCQQLLICQCIGGVR